MDARDIPGVMGGSRIFEQPAWRAEIEAWHAFLDSDGPTLLEIGFDHGRRLTATAETWPDWRVAGIEIRRRRVEQARQWAVDHGLSNLLAWRADARTVLQRHTPPMSLDVIEALFPTPWPDEQADRRLITPAFFAAARDALVPGGVLHVATDLVEIAEHARLALLATPGLVADPSAEDERPAIDQQSRREWACARDKLPVYRFWLRRAGG